MRWAATPGGNLALTRDTQHYLESDFATVLMGAGGEVQVTNKQKSRCLPWVCTASSVRSSLGLLDMDIQQCDEMLDEMFCLRCHMWQVDECGGLPEARCRDAVGQDRPDHCCQLPSHLARGALLVTQGELLRLWSSRIAC